MEPAGAVHAADQMRMPTPGRYEARRRIGARRPLVIGGIVLVLVLTIGAVALAARTHNAVPVMSRCTFASTTVSAPYTITPEQAQNAAIIAAVAFRKGLADHAVTVALATSMQETGLRNLSYGDLDSIGLFQQRPSQGWGTRAQILDPEYAASVFFDHLTQVTGWQAIPVTEAAQLVQHSASPNAYAAWETEARSLARALTGEVPAGLSCSLTGYSGAVPGTTALTQALTSEAGTQLLGVPLSTKTGWQVADWAVAHASRYHLSSVTFGGMAWTVASGTWAPTTASGLQPALSTVTVTRST